MRKIWQRGVFAMPTNAIAAATSNSNSRLIMINKTRIRIRQDNSLRVRAHSLTSQTSGARLVSMTLAIRKRLIIAYGQKVTVSRFAGAVRTIQRRATSQSSHFCIQRLTFEP